MAVFSTDPTLGTKSSIGTYFGVVSTIPSVVFAGWMYLLFASGAAHGSPSFELLKANNPLEHPGYLFAALTAALGLALVGHPAQFTLVQLMEGYWGPSRLGRNLRTRLVTRQLERANHGRTLRAAAAEVRKLRTGRRTGDLSSLLGPRAMRSDRATALQAIAAQSDGDAGSELLARYPKQLAHTLPTALGNMLRRNEELAGAAVHLPVLTWATHIGMVAEPTHTAYLSDQRTQLDLAVRMTASTGAAAVLTFLLLWPRHWWVCAALIPYAACWASYRGAVASANTYGRALVAWVDLNRFRLYDALQLEPVDTVADERRRNDQLKEMALGQDEFDVRLAPPVLKPTEP